MQQKDNGTFQGCQAVQGVYVGVQGHTVYSGTLRCGSWACPFCGPRKLKQLRKRLYNGSIALDGVSKYGLKFATLTFGGFDARKPYIQTDTVNGASRIQYVQKYRNGRPYTAVVPLYDNTKMYEKMMEVFNKVRTALARKYGKFMYFRIHEPHKDGVPHLHVLFAGNNIRKKSFYDDLKRLWENSGLGFVQLATIRDRNGRPVTNFNDANHAVNYLCKYLTKGMKTAGKYKRVFSASRGALMPIQKKEWDIMVVIMGRVDDKGGAVEEIIPFDQDIVDILHEETHDPWDQTPPPDVMEVAVNRHLSNLLTKESMQ